MIWAFVDSENKVGNLIVWDGAAQIYIPTGNTPVQVLEGEACGPGYTYDANGSPRFIAPPPQQIDYSFTSFEFLSRFTAEERAEIRAAAQVDAIIADFLMLAQSAQEIRTTHPMTMEGMNYLMNYGIITDARRKEILLIP